MAQSIDTDDDESKGNRTARRAVRATRLVAEPVYGRLNTTCDAYGIGETLMRELVRDGKVVAIKCNGRTLIELASLRAFLASCPRLHGGGAA